MTNTARKYATAPQTMQNGKLLKLPTAKKTKVKNGFAPSAPVPSIRRQLKYLHNLTAALFIFGVTFQILLTAFALANIEQLGLVSALILELMGFGFSIFMLASGFFARWIAINVDSCLHDVRHLVYRK